MRSLVILLFVCASVLPAQQPPAAPKPEQPPADQQVPTFVTGTQEVIVPVTVTDLKGKFVSDLDEKDFTILDEGRPQQIRFFSRERFQPVVVGFLVDQSNAVKIQWKKYQEAITELVIALLPNDKKYAGYMITYSNEAELAVNTTRDPDKLVTKIAKLKPGGGAALYDAIYMACTTRALVLGEPLEPRRVIVVIGDGHDNASKHTLDQVIELAQRNLVTVYAISTVGFGLAEESEKNLQRLAEETGGRVENPLQGNYSDVSGYLSTPSDEGNYAIKVGTGGYAAAIANGIFKSIAAISGEVTTQYILRYIPDTDDTKTTKDLRRIEVKVGLDNVKIRARKGYYPNPVGR